MASRPRTVLPIYCTGGCDVCKDYARELGVPLIVPPPPDWSMLGDYGEQLAAKGGVIDPQIEREISEGQTDNPRPRSVGHHVGPDCELSPCKVCEDRAPVCAICGEHERHYCGAIEPGLIKVGEAHTCTLLKWHSGDHDW